jgi:hypothetical protein
MRGGIKRTICLAALGLAVVPSAAFGAGGIPGGGGAARPVGGGGGGLNSGGATLNGGSPNQLQLSAALGHTIDFLAASGTAGYKDDGSRRTLTVNLSGVPFGLNNNTTAVDIELDGVLQAEVPVGANGTVKYTADTGHGDSIPALRVGSAIDVFDAADQIQILFGTFR